MFKKKPLKFFECKKSVKIPCLKSTISELIKTV